MGQEGGSPPLSPSQDGGTSLKGHHLVPPAPRGVCCLRRGLFPGGTRFLGTSVNRRTLGGFLGRRGRSGWEGPIGHTRCRLGLRQQKQLSGGKGRDWGKLGYLGLGGRSPGDGDLGLDRRRRFLWNATTTGLGMGILPCHLWAESGEVRAFVGGDGHPVVLPIARRPVQRARPEVGDGLGGADALGWRRVVLLEL